MSDAYTPIIARLIEISELREAKILDHSRLLKAADLAGWNTSAVEKADLALEEARALSREEDDLLSSAEKMLAAEGYRLPPEALIPEEFARWWRKDLTTESVAPTRIVEDVLDQYFDKLVSYVPQDWLKEQRSVRAAIGNNHLLEPVALYGTISANQATVGVHRFAYALMLAEDSRNQVEHYDMYEGALLVPLIVGLCASLDSLDGVQGGPEKLREIVRAPSSEVDSRLYEFAVATRAAALGRKIEFLPQVNKEVNKSVPDLRIHDLGFPAVAECKMQQRLSRYEIHEFSLMREVFGRVEPYYRDRGVIGNLTMQLRLSANDVGVYTMVDAAIEFQMGLNPYRTLEFDWGLVSLSPLSPTVILPGATRLYSPDFLEHVFGWHVDRTEYDGICATVQNNHSMRVAQAELPFCLEWRVVHEGAVERKARSLASQLAEAHNQIPVGESGFLYLAYEEPHRNVIADSRTERLLNLVTKWEVRKRGIFPQRIVINRLYPRAIHEGRPDLIESAVRISPHDEDVWYGRMPGAVFTESAKISTET